MLDEKIESFISYCRVAGFKEKSIQTLSLRLNEFNNFLQLNRISRVRSVTYSHLSAFVADYRKKEGSSRKRR